MTTTSSDEVISQSKELVRRYKAQLAQAPRNPIKLVELARAYATLGSLKKAVRTMNVAVALAPANRYVLRSAARLYVHAKEFDGAHYIVRRAPSLRDDPWLLAAEIATSSMRDKTSGLVNAGWHLINDANHTDFEISELASALATLELRSGSDKRARKLFRRALRQPTENTVAQAEWASRTMSDNEPSCQRL